MPAVVLMLRSVLMTAGLKLGRVFVTFPVTAVTAVLVRLVRSVRFSYEKQNQTGIVNIAVGKWTLKIAFMKGRFGVGAKRVHDQFLAGI